MIIEQFKEYLNKERILEKLLQYYNPKLPYEEIENLKGFLIEFIEKLDDIEFETNNKDYDIISKSYENIIKHQDRKTSGEFYTPLSIVEYILEYIAYNLDNRIEDLKLIDISCGAGSFLIKAIDKLIERYLILLNRKTIYDLNLEEAKLIINVVKQNIFGIDINPISCILCQINIHFKLLKLIQYIQKLDKDFHILLFNVENYNAMKVDVLKQYDFVVGNPPYLFIRDIPNEERDIIDAGSFNTNKGQYDYYQLFIEIGIRILNPNGKLGFIVPDSLLALSNRQIIREFIYNNTKIKHIYYTGPRFDDPVVSNIIIILQRESNITKRENNRIHIKLNDKQEKQISQRIIKNWGYKFLICLNERDIENIEYLSKNFPTLEDLNHLGFQISINRGVELAKTGEIIFCDRCMQYYPVPKKKLKCPECGFELKTEYIEQIVYDKIPNNFDSNIKPFISSINRYETKEIKYIRINKEGINYKDLNIYENRIIIRQLSQDNLICATFNEVFSITSQSFYNLQILQTSIPEFNNLYLLGLINSRLLSYYLFNLFSSYKKLFPRILIEKIKILPIKLPKTEIEKQLAKKIEEKVRSLLNKLDKEIEREIDMLVFDLYQIPKENREYIMRFIENS